LFVLLREDRYEMYMPKLGRKSLKIFGVIAVIVVILVASFSSQRMSMQVSVMPRKQQGPTTAGKASAPAAPVPQPSTAAIAKPMA
jgi:hypothetical protein